jgi:2-oxoisovalerate dehydrogenase E2 component (dihydrolipoyl transacylase)
LIDVDIDGDLAGVDEIPAPPSEQNDLKLQEHSNLAMEAAEEDKKGVLGADDQQTLQEVERKLIEPSPELSPVMTKQCKSETAIMTPAVRHLLKELNLEVSNIQGTGRAGRVLKEDVQRHVAATQTSLYIPKTTQTTGYNARRTSREDKVISLTPIQYQMLRVMTQSLGTPHFLYTHTVNITPLNNFRKRINGNPTLLTSILHLEDKIAKLNPLAFIMKALSEAFSRYPMLNSQLDTQTNAKKAQLVLKGSHNFGIAVDTPQGLLVPVIRDVQDHSIVSLAAEIQRISRIAKDGRLGVEDFKGATFAISNIGSIGGGIVSPIILPPMVGIVGIGRVKEVPAFEKDEVGSERIVKREEVVLSWSADHRVLDGATVAKCAEVVGTLVENFEVLGVTLR